MARYLLFGAGLAAPRFLAETLPRGEVIAFADNDPRKWGTRLLDRPVVGPAELARLEWDEIVISSTATYPIFQQLVEMGVPEEKIRAPLFAPENRRRWEELRGAQTGRRVFIIGNGPSLELTDLDRLHTQGELSFAFNKIYLAFGQTRFRPTYYLVEDNLVAQNCTDDIRRLSGFTKFFPDFLIPVLGRPDEETVLFNFQVQPPERFEPAFSLEPFLVHSGYTCTYSALQLALWLGCSPIVLTGVDFSFIFSPLSPDGKHVHNGELNHFLTGYRRNGERWNPPYLEQTRRAYQLAKKVADERGVEILNATRGGKLDVFPRANLDQILNR